MLKDTTRRVQVGSEGPAGRLDDKQRDRKTFESPLKERKPPLWATALAGRRTAEDYSTTTLALDGDKMSHVLAMNSRKEEISSSLKTMDGP